MSDVEKEELVDGSGGEEEEEPEHDGSDGEASVGDGEQRSDDESVASEEANAAFDSSSKKKAKKSSGSPKTKKSKKDKKRPRDEAKLKSKSKSKRSNVGRFFDEEAYENDELEDEEEVAEVRPEILTREEQEARNRVDQRHRRNQEQLNTKTAEEIAREYDERQRQEMRHDRAIRKAVDHHVAAVGGSGGRRRVLTRMETLPTYNDPRIYKLRCKPGQEEIAIRAILLKAVDLRNREGFSKVKSAFFGNSKGFIYVEAWSEAFVREIINPLRMIYSNSLQVIPTKDMTQLLEVASIKKPLQLYQFVRLKRGPNKGDLARILEILDGGDRVVYEVVPRVEYLDEAAKNENRILGTGSKVRPLQRYFDPEQARAVSANQIMSRRQFPSTPNTPMMCDIWNNDYYHNGFLIKEVRTDIWIATGIDAKPTLDELKMFQIDRHEPLDAYANLQEDEEDEDKPEDDEEGHELKSVKKMNQLLEQEIAKMAGHEVANFAVGDYVQVIEGDLKNLVAQVVSIETKTQIAKVVSLQEVFKGTIEVELSYLMKYITPGVHVKVMSGTYTGTTGRVISVSSVLKDPVAVLLTDASNDEIQVNVALLQVSEEVSIGGGSLAGYELYDLVALSETESAVIISVGTQKLKVMNHLGNIRDIVPQEIRFKQNVNSLRAFTNDSNGQRMRVGDMVTVNTGEMAGQTGTIKHISKIVVWLHQNNYHKNHGIFVVKGKQCTLSGGSSSSSSQSNNNRSQGGAAGVGVGGRQSYGGNSVTSTPLSGSGSAYGYGGNGNGEFRVGSQIKITKGAYRSMLGVILNMDGNYVQVELSARMKKVQVKKDEIRLADSVADPTMMMMGGMTAGPGPSHYGGGGYDNFMAGAETPFLATQTPNYIGSETPRFASGSETPSFFGSETPSFEYGNGGSYTPRYDEAWRITAADLDRHTSSAYDNIATPGGSIVGQTPVDDRKIPTSHTVTPMSAVSSFYNSVPSTPLESHSSGISSSAAPTYIPGMVVLLSAGSDMGKLAVVMAVDSNEYSLRLRLRDGSGTLCGQEFSLPMSSVKPKEPPKKATVRIIGGESAGETGTVVTVSGKQAFIQTPKGKNMFELNNVVWMNA